MSRLKPLISFDSNFSLKDHRVSFFNGVWTICHKDTNIETQLSEQQALEIMGLSKEKKIKRSLLVKLKKSSFVGDKKN